jgi:hypothetical protein
LIENTVLYYVINDENMRHLSTFDVKKVAEFVKTLPIPFAEYYGELIEGFGDASGQVPWFAVADTVGRENMNMIEANVVMFIPASAFQKS